MWKQHFLHRREKKSVVKFSRMRRCTRLDTARTFGIYPKVRLEISVVRGSRDSRDTEEKSFSGLTRTIYAGIREISAHDSSEFRKLVTFLERNDKLELELARSLARSPAHPVSSG